MVVLENRRQCWVPSCWIPWLSPGLSVVAACGCLTIRVIVRNRSRKKKTHHGLDAASDSERFIQEISEVSGAQSSPEETQSLDGIESQKG